MKSSARVLVVDDEKNLRTTLADVLAEEGYDVRSAETGERAIELCARERFDIILMDVRMPGLNGVETFRRIRQNQHGVRVIMMSGYSVEELRSAALEEGAIAFLSKPVDLDHVVRLIRELSNPAVLAIEPDDALAASIREGLRERGFRATVVSNAREALALLDQVQFDVLLIDSDQAAGGPELYLLIRRLTPSAVAVLITDRVDPPIVTGEAGRTVYSIVRKPISVPELLSLVERAVHGAAANN